MFTAGLADADVLPCPIQADPVQEQAGGTFQDLRRSQGMHVLCGLPTACIGSGHCQIDPVALWFL